NQDRMYRLCENYVRQNICNWAIPADELHVLCQSCRFTQVVPNLSEPGNKTAWYKLELAKRRLLYTLMNLGCGPKNKVDDPERGLAFAFLADDKACEGTPVLTGHANGLITI